MEAVATILVASQDGKTLVAATCERTPCPPPEDLAWLAHAALSGVEMIVYRGERCVFVKAESGEGTLYRLACEAGEA